ncbi:aldehyde dehydrogenase family protein, partial [Chitinophaga sp.]|uniref:aldehyde dehydrogenase family protein n=1 Tax=Chitinophaga sp. TaxID=1869181 RepID=UPI002FDD725C
MSNTIAPEATLSLTGYIAGQPVYAAQVLEVRSPYDGRLAGTVALASRRDTEAAIAAGLSAGVKQTRYERFAVLDKTRQLLEERKEEFARLITSESGLAIREARYEVGRARDVLHFAALESLKDDGQIFSCDISPQGKARKIFTTREPLSLAVAITPFNHP